MRKNENEKKKLRETWKKNYKKNDKFLKLKLDKKLIIQWILNFNNVKMRS